MNRYRIAIQESDGKSKDFRNVMIHSRKSIDTVQKVLREALGDDYKRWEKNFTQRLLQAVHNKNVAAHINDDRFDKHAVGNDISNEEFLENEIFFARME